MQHLLSFFKTYYEYFKFHHYFHITTFIIFCHLTTRNERKKENDKIIHFKIFSTKCYYNSCFDVISIFYFIINYNIWCEKLPNYDYFDYLSLIQIWLAFDYNVEWFIYRFKFSIHGRRSFISSNKTWILTFFFFYKWIAWNM